jgi:hypothetical protein
MHHGYIALPGGFCAFTVGVLLVVMLSTPAVWRAVSDRIVIGALDLLGLGCVRFAPRKTKAG